MNSGASDIVYTAAVSGVAANFLRPSLEAMGITQEMVASMDLVGVMFDKVNRKSMAIPDEYRERLGELI